METFVTKHLFPLKAVSFYFFNGCLGHIELENASCVSEVQPPRPPTSTTTTLSLAVKTARSR